MGKRVLVTGASSGIGRATAIAFACEGAEILLSDVDAQGLEPVRQIVLALGANCSAYAVDVADEVAMSAFATMVHAQGGPVDVLVNTARAGMLGPLDPAKAWQRAVGTNVIGAVHGLRLFLPKMHDAGGPRRVVNVLSMGMGAATPHPSVYAASRSPVLGLSDALSVELRILGSEVGGWCFGR